LRDGRDIMKINFAVTSVTS